MEIDGDLGKSKQRIERLPARKLLLGEDMVAESIRLNQGRMSLTAEMILFLIVAVGVVMVLTGYFILHQRESILARALRNELSAHAVTLQLALEDSYRAGRISDAQRLIDQLSKNARVFSVILFDEEGQVALSYDHHCRRRSHSRHTDCAPIR